MAPLITSFHSLTLFSSLGISFVSVTDNFQSLATTLTVFFLYLLVILFFVFGYAQWKCVTLIILKSEHIFDLKRYDCKSSVNCLYNGLYSYFCTLDSDPNPCYPLDTDQSTHSIKVSRKKKIFCGRNLQEFLN